MNTARQGTAEAKREERDREVELVAAGDRGPRDYYKVAGYGRIGFIVAVALVLGLFAQHELRHQSYLFGSLALFAAVFVLSMIGSATPWGVRSRARSDARSLARSAARLLKKHRAKLSPAAIDEVEEALVGIHGALSTTKAGTPAVEARARLDGALERHLSFARKSAAREYTESIGGAILVALLLRAFVFEP
ncbi:MAG: hypothetical protein ACJ781_13060, partial [Myxococcales bacterium]